MTPRTRYGQGHEWLLDEVVAKRLKPLDVVAYLRLALAGPFPANEDEWQVGCALSLAALADQIGCSERTAQRVVARLECVGAIEQRRRQQRAAVYKLRRFPPNQTPLADQASPDRTRTAGHERVRPANADALTGHLGAPDRTGLAGRVETENPESDQNGAGRGISTPAGHDDEPQWVIERDFYEMEDVQRLTNEAQLLFIFLISSADDEGRFRGCLADVGAPPVFRDCRLDAHLAELVGAGLVTVWTFGAVSQVSIRPDLCAVAS